MYLTFSSFMLVPTFKGDNNYWMLYLPQFVVEKNCDMHSTFFNNFTLWQNWIFISGLILGVKIQSKNKPILGDFPSFFKAKSARETLSNIWPECKYHDFHVFQLKC